MSKIKSCYITHNLDERSIGFIEEIGGIICPSLAIVRNDHEFKSFGQISLLVNKNKLNPRRDSIHNCDSSSVRYPQRYFKWDSKILDKLSDKIENLTPDLSKIHCRFRYFQDSEQSKGFDAVAESLTDDIPTLVAYARDNGINPRIFKKELRVSVGFIDDHIESAAIKKIIHTAYKNKELKSPEFQDQMKAFVIAHAKNIAGESNFETFSNKLLERHFSDKGKGHLKFSYQHSIEDYAQRYSREPRPIDTGKLHARLTNLINSPTKKSRFINWLGKHIERGYHSPYFYSNNTKHKTMKPYHADYLFKEMKGKVAGHEYNTFGGANNIRAQVAIQFSSFRQIENAMNKLVSEADMKVIASSFNSRLSDLPSLLASEYQYDTSSYHFRDAVYNELTTFACTGSIRSLKSFDEIDEEKIRHIKGYFYDIKNAPTHYFEAKKQAIMDLDEFSAAIVPKGTAKETLHILKKAGVPVTYYDPNVEHSRLRAINKHKELQFGNYIEPELEPPATVSDNEIELSM